MSRGLRVRLPLLIAVVAGALLWKSNLFIQTRELTVTLPGCERLASVDLQIYDAEGRLLRRMERSFGGGSGGSLKEELALRRGRYDVSAFLKDTRGGAWHVHQALDVDRERALFVELSCKP